MSIAVNKGDRLDRAVTVVNKRPIAKRPDKIMDGCDPAFSPLSVYASAQQFLRPLLDLTFRA